MSFLTVFQRLQLISRRFCLAEKTGKWLAVLSVVLIALTGFSRNFLGVQNQMHTCLGSYSFRVIAAASRGEENGTYV